MLRGWSKFVCNECGHKFVGMDFEYQCTALSAPLLTSSLRHPKFLIKEFSYFLMPCHQHGLRINLLV